MQLGELTTIKGKPITSSASTRVPLNVLFWLRKKAEAEGITVAGLLYSWIMEKYESEVEASRANTSD